MKVRLGFVSNSSSSSFCIYGSRFTFGELRAVASSIPEYQEAVPESCDEENEDWDFDLVIDIVEAMVTEFDGIREHDAAATRSPSVCLRYSRKIATEVTFIKPPRDGGGVKECYS